MGSYLKLLSAICYMIGCSLLIPAGVLLLYPLYYNLNITFFIVGCSILTIGGFVDFIPAFYSKPRIEDIGDKESLTNTRDSELFMIKYSNWKKDIIVTFSYLLGGILFLLGSCMYLPAIVQDLGRLGTWIFRLGSFAYLTGSFTSLYRIYKSHKKEEKISLSTAMWIAVLLVYIMGSFTYLTGGILNEAHLPFGNEMWVIGGVCFATGGILGYIETQRTWKK
jgi:hypothetical protein